MQACTFIKKRLQQRRFPVKLAEFLRTPILKNIYDRLPLKWVNHKYDLHVVWKYRSSRPEVFLEISQNSPGKHMCQSLFFLKKETLAQVFSRWICEISKNTFLYKTPLVAASESKNKSVSKIHIWKRFLFYCVFVVAFLNSYFLLMNKIDFKYPLTAHILLRFSWLTSSVFSIKF